MAPAAQPAPRRRAARGQGAELRERLLEVTTELIGELGGTADVSIRRVTGRAGVSPMAFYLHFPDRETLFEEVIHRGFERFIAALAAAAAGGEAPRDALRRMGAGYLRFAREEPALYTVIFGRTWPDGDAPARPAAIEDKPPDSPGARAFARLVDAVEACLAETPSELGAKTIALGLWSALHGYAGLTATRPGVGWPDEDAYSALLLDRWLPAGPAPPA